MKNIGILTFFGKSTHGDTFVARLVEVQRSLVKEQYVVAPDLSVKDLTNIHFFPITYRTGTTVLSQIWHQIKAQLQMSYNLTKLSRKVNLWIFFGGDVLLLPMLFAKLANKKVVVFLAGNLDAEIRLKKNPLNLFQKLMRRICLAMSNHIAIYSHSLVKKWHLEKFENKLIIIDTHYMDFDLFKLQTPFAKREIKIGYVGRLSAEKGLINFLESLPFLLSKFTKLEVMIVGDGPLTNKVQSWIENNNFEHRVLYCGRIAHDKIAEVLNALQLCVLPSYSEGLPNIMLESMICGTPVLATPVGAIEDVIIQGVNGFILADNASECIASGIIKALESPSLSQISESARKTILEKYSFESARVRYEKAMIDL